MSEWWTYRLSSFLLFSPRTYFRLHELYNAEIWPAQLVALALGVATLAMVRRSGTWPGRCIAVMLAICWTWVALAFHLHRYATINWAATYFAAAFVVEALLLLWLGAFRGRLTSAAAMSRTQRVGLYVFLFALVVQPALGPLVGRDWRQSEIFGVAPDPTAVGTLGILLLTSHRVPWGLMIIPLLWCAVSGALQWTMRSPDAPVMPLLALLVLLAAATRSMITRGAREA